jgi:hypothetical protein
MFALPQDQVRQVLGNARFLLESRHDVEVLNEAIATASPEANHAMAIWDPQAMGYSAETVAYDLANLATHAIHKIRVNSTRNNPVSFTFRIWVGDYVFRIRGTQAHRGGDIIARVVDWARSETFGGPMNEFIAKHVRRGGRVMAWDEDGRGVSADHIPFDERSW